MSKQIILTTTGTNNWTVPVGWNNSSNSIEVIGAGGSGGVSNQSGYGVQGGGGAGGGYGKTTNLTLTPGATVSYTIGIGGVALAQPNNTHSNGNDGGSTYFNGASIGAASVGAYGGQGGVVGGTSTGGGGVGTLTYTGGSGTINSGQYGGGAGGAAGPNGNGGNAVNGSGGQGDNGSGGTAGNDGTEYGSSPNYGSGGGGNTGNQSTGQTGGKYGAGGGGVGPYGGSSGAGTQGLIVITYTPSILYWISGGTGNWNSATNWSVTSGGSAGTDTPTSITNVVFDGNSGSGTSTINASSVCNSLTMTGFTGTLAGSNTLAISGNLTLASGMTNSYTGAITFNSTTSQTITTAGKTIASAVTFNGSGGMWTLQDNLNSTTTTTITNGTLSLSGFDYTCTTISNSGTLTLSSGTLSCTTLTNSGTINANTSIISLSGTGSVWSNTGTFTCGTSTIKLTNASSSSKTFNGGGGTFYNFYITGSGTGAYTIVGNNTFNDFKCDTPPHTINFTAGSKQTLNTFTVSGTAGNLMTLQSTVAGSNWYLYKQTSGQVSCDYLSLQDSHVEII